MGWRHFEFTVPENWDITMEGQAGKVFYFRVVDPYRPQLEVNWEKIPFEKAMLPEDMLKKYREELDKKLSEFSKKGVDVKARHVSKEEVKIHGHDGILWIYSIRGDKVAAAFWYCEKSERAVTLVFTPEKLDIDLVKRILAGFKCHYNPGEKALWSLLLLNLYLPTDLRLILAKFTTAHSIAVFKRPDEYFYIGIGYSGIANVILAKYRNSAKRWFDKTLRKEISKSIRVQIPSPKYKEEDGVLSFKGESFAIPSSRKKVFKGQIWLDRRIGRFLVLTAIYEKRYEEEIGEVLSDLKRQLEASSAFTVI